MSWRKGNEHNIRKTEKLGLIWFLVGLGLLFSSYMTAPLGNVIGTVLGFGLGVVLMFLGMVFYLEPERIDLGA